MKYTYFVSYLGEGSVFGNKMITLDHELETIEHIRAIERHIAQKYKIEGRIAILSFQITRFEHDIVVEPAPQADKNLVVK